MRKRLKYIFGGALAVVIAMLLGVYVFNFSHEEVFPNKNAVNYHYGFYHEDIEENWSTVNLDSSGHSFKMSYILSRATRNPFVAGFIAVDTDNGTLANFYDHNTLRINLSSNVGMRIPVMLTFDYKKGEKKKNGKPFPMVTLRTFIDYEESGEYDIAFDELHIPDWWYRVHRLHRDEVDLKKITNLKGIVIGSCSILREKVRDTIEVGKIEFYTDNSFLYLVIVGLAVVFAIILITLLFALRKPTRQMVKRKRPVW